MARMNQVEKSLGEQVADLLDRMPQNYDVTFCVGPDKVKVKAVKIILKAASPVFQNEFDDKWENGVMKEGGGIPLPDVDPTIFETFVKLIISDTWSLDFLNALNMSPNTKLSLLGLCRRYEITKAIKNFEEIAKEFLESFGKYMETPEVLEVSQENLETIFACEEIPMREIEIFDCACRWAGNQCTNKGLEPTGENYREVLGGCLFEIRFPAMSVEDFTKAASFKKNILTKDEKLAIYEYIGLDIEDKANFEKSQLQFKTKHRLYRGSFGCLVLSLPQQYKSTKSIFVCNDSQHVSLFQVSEKISLNGIGFLGPIDGDTYFDVTVQIKRRVNNSYTFDSGKFTKNIFARKGKIIYFLLDEPIVVESSAYDSSWKNRYEAYFSLKVIKGTNKIPQYLDNPSNESIEASGVQFHLYRNYDGGQHLVELLFKKM